MTPDELIAALADLQHLRDELREIYLPLFRAAEAELVILAQPSDAYTGFTPVSW